MTQVDGGTSVASRDALFDLAVARASAYLLRARPPASQTEGDIARALEVWVLKTRFAARVDVTRLAAALASRPKHGRARWMGGEAGGWTEAP